MVMVMKKQGNPLRRRYLRELKSEAGRYLVIFVLLVCAIGFTSGFLVADGSLIAAYDEGFVRYNTEDGNFTAAEKMNRAQLQDAGGLGISVYESFYTEAETDSGSTLRLFKNRRQVNLACLMQGRLPEVPGELALDRMYADNNGLTVGDTVTAADGKSRWTVVGLVALPDYSCLFENNNDSMFDALQFGVGVLSAGEFNALPKEELTWRYAWLYSEPPGDSEIAEKEMAEELLEELGDIVQLTGFLPRYQNQAIVYTREDMGGDRAMMAVFLYIVILIIAFVFSITAGSTIEREAGVIGTLRASGFTRGELVRHYMAMPVLITLISALLGNILGYTVMKEVCAGMYYGSYSLPTYVTVWNAEAFVQTTAVPVLIMLLVNLWVLTRRLRLSPLRFLRRELKKSRTGRAFPLPRVLGFFTRFRLRVALQNLGSYATIFLGVLLANLLLLFGIGMPDLLNNYTRMVAESMYCRYQYMLNLPVELQAGSRKLEKLLAMAEFSAGVETENEDAEKFSAYSLKTTYPDYKSEEITLYGLQPDSRYVPVETGGGAVVISSAMADKYGLGPGDSLTLQEPYGSEAYTLTVTAVTNYDAALYIYMSRQELNELFDLGEDYFCGYFSDTPITDIDEKYIGTVIDLDAMTKISRQLERSMGSMMGMVDGFAMLIFIVVIYIMSKIIIERNAQSISMAKILGYNTMEIARLYVIPTSAAVILSLGVSLPLLSGGLQQIVRYMFLLEMSGWMPYLLSGTVYIKAFGIGVLTYLAVAALELRRIARVPMDAALKNVE